MASQDNKYLIVSSLTPLKKFKIKLKDLNSRFGSFIDIGIDLPTDDLLKVILTKNFSEKQIEVSKKNIDYIVKNIERSYEKINLFTNSIDSMSLTSFSLTANSSLINGSIADLEITLMNDQGFNQKINL